MTSLCKFGGDEKGATCPKPFFQAANINKTVTRNAALKHMKLAHTVLFFSQRLSHVLADFRAKKKKKIQRILGESVATLS